MSARDSDTRFCEVCGAPLAHHPEGALCARCLALFSLRDVEPGCPDPGDREPPNGEEPPGVAIPPLEVKARYGDYELLEEIAHGGMGVVYRARQISLNRIVAVKMVLYGQFAAKAAFERFRAEAETAARLQHPNIVAIHGIGEADGQPYFSMDYVPGQNLADLVRDRPLPVRKGAGYVRKIALAVHYAHTQGVLHRDLKPANVLIDENDEPRVTDFGIARRLAGDSQFTLTGQVVGSPNFMPPEQGAGAKVRLTPASDVYGLGSMLYYLLTARPPFVAETFEATLAQVLNNEPVSPRELNPGLPRDLETICLKCLEKDPARRYPSAQDLADELDRFLKGEPILARPLGPLGKGWRWCRRKPALAGMAAAIVILLITATAVSLVAARRNEAQARNLRRNLYAADMNVVYHAIQDNNLSLASELLNKYVPEKVELHASGRNAEDLRGWEWRYLWKLSRGDPLAVLRAHTNNISSVLFSPDGARLVTSSCDGRVQIWNPARRQLLHTLTGFALSIGRNSVAFSPDGGMLAVADGIDIHVFAVTNWTRLRALPNPAWPGRVNLVPIVFSRDGTTLMCNVHGELRQWDTRTWVERKSQLHSPLVDFGPFLALSPDGRQFAVGTDQAVLVCDASNLNSAQPLFKIPVYRPWSVVFSPDSKLVAVGGPRSRTSVWNAEEGKEIQRLDSGVPQAFSPDSKRLATASTMICLWEIGKPEPIATLKGPLQTTLAFAPDGETLAGGGQAGMVALWAGNPKPGTGRWWIHGEHLGFSADGNILAVLVSNRVVEYWDVPSRTRVNQVQLPADLSERVKVAASPDVEILALVETNGVAQVINSRSKQTTAQIDLKRTLKWPKAVISPDHRFVAVSCESLMDGGVGWTGVWDVDRGVVRDLPYTNCYRPAFSADGRLLATGYNNLVQLWTMPDLKPLRAFSGQQSMIKTLVFSQDGLILASSGRSRDILLWDIAAGRQEALLPANTQNTFSLANAFSMDRKTLVSAGGDCARLWNVATGRPLFSLPRLGDGKSPPIFSPDGNKLVARGAADDFGDVSLNGIEVLEAPSIREIEAAEIVAPRFE